jgi:hypothetical protein
MPIGFLVKKLIYPRSYIWYFLINSLGSELDILFR